MMGKNNMAEFSKNVGHLRNAKREIYVQRFNIPTGRRQRLRLTQTFMDQLDGCADDCARRVLLGLGRPR